MLDCTVFNGAPDTDVLIVRIGDWEIVIVRKDGGQVNVAITDHEEGSETSYILGQEDETQRV